jgi:hypothetical protein
MILTGKSKDSEKICEEQLNRDVKSIFICYSIEFANGRSEVLQ